jgi:hypothetical protein
LLYLKFEISIISDQPFPFKNSLDNEVIYRTLNVLHKTAKNVEKQWVFDAQPRVKLGGF